MPWPLDDKPVSPIANALLQPATPAQPQFNALSGMPFVDSATQRQDPMRQWDVDWFLNGNKPMYGSGSRSAMQRTMGDELLKALDVHPSISATNADGVGGTWWYKPGEEARANEIAQRWKGVSTKPGAMSNEQLRDWEHAQGRLYGYDPAKVDAYVSGKYGSLPPASERAIGAGILGGAMKGGVPPSGKKTFLE